ncbi:7 transmembrane receptor domain-containing protein [Stegostoma tigrinum]|uniref:7 transmembrane receptor domain-containing protein n=1 Tax=Stegostoma tigrinum TaxID=3053191 RepID=UPI00286FC9F1|nr:7 transmembrane receptor domain-containing protein [Stegostoma tigrinum]
MENRTAGNGSAAVTFAGAALLQQYKSLFLLLYCGLVAVACTGNSFLIGSIAADRKLHTVTNFFIGNLALADLLMCLACVPPTLSYAFEPRGWLFGRFLCHLVSLLQPALVYVSVLSLTAIAVDRYVVVAHPVRQRVGRRHRGLVVASIWALALALASPAAARVAYVELGAAGHGVNVCEEFWRGREAERLAYSCVVLLASYLLPLSAVSVSYCAVTAHLRRRRLPGAAEHSCLQWSRRKRKAFSLLVVSVVTFAVCWMPLQILNLLRDLDVDFTLLDTRYLNVAQVSCHWLAMSSSCYNPFIYASLHRKLRQQLGAYLRQCRRPGGTLAARLFPLSQQHQPGA